jgi:hypothetical protein
MRESGGGDAARQAAEREHGPDPGNDEADEDGETQPIDEVAAALQLEAHVVLLRSSVTLKRSLPKVSRRKSSRPGCARRT